MSKPFWEKTTFRQWYLLYRVSGANPLQAAWWAFEDRFIERVNLGDL